MALDSLRSLDSAARKPFSNYLETVLSAKTPDTLLTLDTEKRLQALAFNKQHLTEAQVQQVVKSFGDTGFFAPLAHAEQMHYLTQNGQAQKALEVYNNVYKESLSDFIRSELNYRRLKTLSSLKKYDELEQQAQTLFLTDSRAVYRPVALATAFANKNQLQKAIGFYKEAIELNPFHVKHILRYLAGLYNRLDSAQKAYDLVVESIYIHPEDVGLRKFYVKQAARLNLSYFVESGLEELQKRLSAKEFETFKKELEQKGAALLID